jgi:poly-gamma-glutamate synthesis protein (capsule biosynthesis protein)
MASKTLIFGGDFTLGKEPETYMKGVNDLLDGADFRIFQLEEPFLDTLVEGAPPERLTKTLDCVVGKVDLVTLSGNHFYDYGEPGVNDTIAWCERSGIAHAGGGANAEIAKQPACIEKDGVRIGVLAYNCVGSKKVFASADRGGAAGLNFTRGFVPCSMLDQVHTRLERDVWELKAPQHIDEDCMGFNFTDVEAVLAFAEDVRRARTQCDVLLVYFHKGYVHRPVTVAPWERLLSHIAIDNGADAVMGSHSHIAHGVEMYKGKAIYHGLNNFVMYVPQLSPNFKGQVHGGKDSNNAEWVKRRVERFGFVPDPEYPTYPFHPESVYCPVAKLILEDGAVKSYRMVLMKVERDGVPYVHGQGPVGQEIFDYMQRITTEAGLNGRLSWVGDEVEIHSAD